MSTTITVATDGTAILDAEKAMDRWQEDPRENDATEGTGNDFILSYRAQYRITGNMGRSIWVVDRTLRQFQTKEGK